LTFGVTSDQVNTYQARLLCTVCLPNLVLLAQVVFLFKHGHTYNVQTHINTDATGHSTHGLANAGIGLYMDNLTMCLSTAVNSAEYFG